jgi:hypothetical protein
MYAIQALIIRPDTPYCLTDTGPLIHFRGEELMHRGTEIFTAILAAFETRTYEAGELSKMLMEDKKKFYRSHDQVAITLKSATELELQPMVPVPGKLGAQGDKEQAIIVSLPTTPEKLWKKLEKVYSRRRE